MSPELMLIIRYQYYIRKCLSFHKFSEQVFSMGRKSMPCQIELFTHSDKWNDSNYKSIRLSTNFHYMPQDQQEKIKKSGLFAPTPPHRVKRNRVQFRRKKGLGPMKKNTSHAPKIFFFVIFVVCRFKIKVIFFFF